MRLLLLLALLLPTAAHAEDPAEPWCPPDEVELTPTQHLRALSLDLRGVVPTRAEYREVRDTGEISPAMIASWMDSEEFVERVVRLHDALFWNNVDNVALYAAATTLNTFGGAPAFWRRQPATRYRGDDVPCLDEPATFDADGHPETSEQPDGTFREGWVEVAPYWDPENPVQVCAFDAQEAEASPSGTLCDTTAAFSDPGCGCGPNLDWCRRFSAEDMVQDAIAEDLRRRVRSMVREDASYLSLLTDSTQHVNGPLSHYLRKQVRMGGGIRLYPEAMNPAVLPDVPFVDEDSWFEVPGGDHHAGLLTSPAFLLRFQTNRARANRFYNAFLCQPFQPPSDGLPTGGEIVQDLQLRDGCKYCHALLEPAAAHWGRWRESGAGYLSPEDFPALRDDCYACATSSLACPSECNQHYIVNPITPESDPYLGMLNAYEFRRDDHKDYVERGPEALVLQGVVDGRLSDCTVRTALGWLLGRQPTEDEEPWVDELELKFVSGGFDYSELIHDIVTSPVYRRVR